MYHVRPSGILLLSVPNLFEVTRGDMVLGFQWFVVRRSTPSDSMYPVSVTHTTVLNANRFV